MIQKFELSGVHMKIDQKLEDYVTKKIGKLDQYMSRHSKQSAHVEVKLKESKIKEKKQATCDVVLYLPKEVLTTKETTMNMFAAVDIVEAKLKNQLKKYKDLHERPYHLHRRMLARFRRSSDAV
jgi:ribosomal subunit interface protein